MALCPWCKVEVGELPASSPCPKCKRAAKDHPWLKSNAPPKLGSGLWGTGLELGGDEDEKRSVSPAPFVLDAPTAHMQATADLQLDLAPAATTAVQPMALAPTVAHAQRRVPSFEGELDLGAPPAPPSAPSPRVSNPAPPVSVPAPPRSQPELTGRSVLDDDDDLMSAGGDLALDIDVGNGAALPPSISAPRLPVSHAPASNPSLPPHASGGYARVSGAPVSAAPAVPDEIDPFEARALGDYGDPPTNPLLSPLYAWRVTRRRAELQRQLALKKEEAARARQRSEDALVTFGERVRPAAEQAQSRALDEVRAAEELLRSRDGGLAAEMDAHRVEVSRVDERLNAVDAELAAAQAEEKRILEELARATEVRDRAAAKMKRAEIEIRNATALLNKGGTQ